MFASGQELAVEARRRQAVNGFVQGRAEECIGAQMDFRLLCVQKTHGRFRNRVARTQVVGVAVGVIEIPVVRLLNELAFLGDLESP